MADLDKVTQQNASLVEESTAASESLEGAGGEMSEPVSVFRACRPCHRAARRAAVKLAAPTHTQVAREA